MSDEAPSRPAGDSPLSRLTGVFFSPVRTFEAVARRPTWIAPLLLWAAASLAVTAALLPRIDYERAVREQLEKSSRTMSEGEVESLVEKQKSIGGVIGYILAVVSPALITAVVAGVLFLAFKAFGRDLSFRQGFGITAHAFLPGILAALLLIPVVMGRETVDPSGLGDLLRSNPGFLVDRKEAPGLHSLLQSFDLFSLWTAALLVIGFAVATRSSRAQTAAIVLSLWGLWILGKTGFAILVG